VRALADFFEDEVLVHEAAGGGVGFCAGGGYSAGSGWWWLVRGLVRGLHLKYNISQ
jgi:hypothetical protein